MEEYLEKEDMEQTPYSPKSITLFDDNLDEEGNLIDETGLPSMIKGHQTVSKMKMPWKIS